MLTYGTPNLGRHREKRPNPSRRQHARQGSINVDVLATSSFANF
jgi:hypothetical protein